MKLSYLYGKLMKNLQGTCVIDSQITKGARVGKACNVVRSTIGRHSYCSHDCQFVDTEIGAFCSISDHVFVGGPEHPISWVGTSPVFQKVKHSGLTVRFAEFNLPPSKRTIIGSDVWIGHGVTIKSGVTIGHGAVIGSNALVTKDVPPFAIVGGVPAKLIRYRFDEDTVTSLLDSKWWELSDEEIRILSSEIQDPKAFIIKLNSIKK